MTFILPELTEQLSLPWSPEWDLEKTRARNENLFPEQEITLDGASLSVTQANGIEVRIWSPANPDKIILAVHGGGYTAGRAHEDDERNGHIAVEFNAVVISPEYRLAPEHPFPTPPRDCLAALDWALATYPSLPVYLYGDSAGAGLVETIACWHIDRGGLPLAGLICFEPALDPAVNTPSMTTYGMGPMWSKEKARGSWQAYLAGQDASILPRLTDRYRSAQEATIEVTGEGTREAHPSHPASQLPPVLVFVNPVDPLRDEGVEWALGLADAGARIELHLMPGTYHSALSISGTRTWQRVQNIIHDFMELFPPETLPHTTGPTNQN